MQGHLQINLMSLCSIFFCTVLFARWWRFRIMGSNYCEMQYFVPHSLTTYYFLLHQSLVEITFEVNHQAQRSAMTNAFSNLKFQNLQNQLGQKAEGKTIRKLCRLVFLALCSIDPFTKSISNPDVIEGIQDLIFFGNLVQNLCLPPESSHPTTQLLMLLILPKERRKIFLLTT